MNAFPQIVRPRLSSGQYDLPRSRRVDVIVVGGGPAGSSAARALALAGYAVTLFERSRYGTVRIGETLPPEVRWPLTELGIWERFLADGHLESPGVVSAWGRPELYANDFIVNPNGPGWHVDRQRFDTTLADAAAEAGAEILLGARAVVRQQASSPPWCVEAEVDESRLDRQAAFVMDATGRSSSIWRRFGGRRTGFDRLLALFGFFPTRPSSGSDRRTLIETVEKGWWYTAPLPGDRQIVTLFTDAGLLPRRHSARADFWRGQLANAPHTQERVGRATPSHGIRTVSARSERLDGKATPGLLAVGDAAATFDPLSSQGITWALESGVRAAQAIDAHHRGNGVALRDYRRWIESEYAGYLRTRTEYYTSERRWPGSAFWRARQTEASSV